MRSDLPRRTRSDRRPGRPTEPPLADPPAGGALHGLDAIAHRGVQDPQPLLHDPDAPCRAGGLARIAHSAAGCSCCGCGGGRAGSCARHRSTTSLPTDRCGSWPVSVPATEWYRNLLADPAVEVWLPTRHLAGTAVEVRSPAVRARILPALVRSTGAAVVPGRGQPVDGDGRPDHRRAGLRAADPHRPGRRLAGPGSGRPGGRRMDLAPGAGPRGVAPRPAHAPPPPALTLP